MIPKKIHYIWFGDAKKPEIFKKSLESVKKYCPSYEVKIWTLEDFKDEKNIYFQKMIEKKAWAFASDYARIKILYENGGIYLDIDMEILKNLDNFLQDEFFIGFQDPFFVGAGIIGAKKNNDFLKSLLDFYDKQTKKIVIPNLITKKLKKIGLKKYNSKIQKIGNLSIYPKEFFYPYSFYEKFSDNLITKNTYAIHHYNASWLPKFITIFIFPFIGFFAKIFYRNKNFL